MQNINEDLMYVQNIQERENHQVPEIIQNIHPIINNQVPQEQNIQFIQENINGNNQGNSNINGNNQGNRNINDNNLPGLANIRYRPNEFYYVWYCLRHGDCFLTSINREPERQDSRCGVLNECYYDYLGVLNLVRGIRFFTEDGMDIRNYFENQNDGYTVDMFNNMISSPEERNNAILF
tara:strand:+ start:47 stop:583 length:537 start_codon:yes stop_codon:yes gene_type:complete